MLPSLLFFIALSSRITFRCSAATTASVRSPRVPPRTTLNSNVGSSSITPKHGVDIKKNKMPDIDILVDHAEFALNSYLPSSEILKTLRRSKTNVRIIQRTLDHVGASYNIIQYSDKSTENVRWVISIPGSRNNKNYQQNMDNKLVLDDVLNIKVHRFAPSKPSFLNQTCHYRQLVNVGIFLSFICSLISLSFFRGYRSVYRAILADFILEESRMRGLFGSLTGENGGFTEVPKSRISLSVTGHSLGYELFDFYVLIAIALGNDMITQTNLPEALVI